MSGNDSLARSRLDGRGLSGGRPVAVILAAVGCLQCGRPTDDPKTRPGTQQADAGADAGPSLWCAERACFPEQSLSDGLLPVPVAEVKRLFAWDERPEDGPCIYEPQNGALFPQNSLRPRVRFEPSELEDLWEIRWSAETEEHDLVVYTSSLSRTKGHVIWPMPEEIWDGLSTSAQGSTIEVRVRGTSTSDNSVRSESHTEFTIAPVLAPGSIVYWSTNGAFGGGGETTLRGFSMGDEGTAIVLEPNDVQQFPSLNEFASPKEAAAGAEEGRVRCIGCHTSTPDGDAVAFVDSWPWNSVLASIKDDDRGARPSYVSEATSKIIQQPWQGSPTFSSGHWATGKRWMVQSFGSRDPGWQPPPSDADGWNATGHDQLIWFDLDYQGTLPELGRPLSDAVEELRGVAYDFIAREGDEDGAVNPDWSHNGEWIAYVSAEKTLDGHSGGRVDEEDIEFDTDIRIVPFNDGAGGPADALGGASSDNHREYYPDFSSDDEFIAFTRSEGTTGPAYYRGDGEIFVVPSKGGEALRLSANDPPACSGEVSPGVHNSWPKWAPSVKEDDEGRKYYWLIFSSARRYVGQFDLVPDEYSPGGPSSQLYMAGIIVEGGEIVEHFPAVYLWNQTTNASNLTPAWDEIQIPDVENPR